ncbi:MAG: ROK family protein [Rectinemataceae bacterium]|nr:ROK family protein [Rectinemataceae bacterium]
MEKLYAGLDIGGQSIKGMVLDADGKVRRELSRVTPSSEGAAAVLAVIGDLIRELSMAGEIASVGVGTPGGVDRQGVIVGIAANISGWYGTRLGEEIAVMAQAPCGVRNDGNIAAFAEWAVRGGRSRGLLFVGLGTGIGGGYIEDGRILGGRNDMALEIGHIVVEPQGRPCNCGVDGCSEAYTSGPSIGRIATALGRAEDALLGTLARAAAPAASWQGSALAARALSGELFNAREVYDAYSVGDPLAIATDAIASEALARAVSTALAMLAPDTVVIGGGVLAGAPHLVRRIAELVPRYVYEDAWKHCNFEQARLGHKAGLLGAALYGASLVVDRSELLGLALRASGSI